MVWPVLGSASQAMRGFKVPAALKLDSLPSGRDATVAGTQLLATLVCAENKGRLRGFVGLMRRGTDWAGFATDVGAVVPVVVPVSTP